MKLLNLFEVAERLGVTAGDVRDMRAAGQLSPAVAYPRGYRRFEKFDREDVDRALVEMYPSRTYDFGRETVTVVYDERRLP